jgi:chromosome partitioning protein
MGRASGAVFRYRAVVTVMALVNQKGGVGKTTVALGLASVAWIRHRKCLIIDLDPQGNATTGMAIWEPAVSIDEALADDRPGAASGLRVQSGWPNDAGRPPRVVPSTAALATRELQLLTDPIGAQDRLRTALTGLDEPLVIIDCPPSIGLLTINGLFAADKALIVTEPGAWASDGVAQILRTVERISMRRSTPLTMAGVAVNRLGRTRDARYWDDQLRSDHGDLVLPPIHMRAAVPEAAARSLPIHALVPRPGAAEAASEFEEVFDMVLGAEVVHGL